MNIRIVAVGRLKESYLREGVAEYSKRLTPYCKLELVELQDEALAEGGSPSKRVQGQAFAQSREGSRILKALTPGLWVVALDIKGCLHSSEELAAYMEGLAIQGKSDLAFVIGGASGLAPEVLQRSDYRLSLSPMTFTHQLTRVILLEQLYRSFRIRAGEPYHK